VKGTWTQPGYVQVCLYKSVNPHRLVLCDANVYIVYIFLISGVARSHLHAEGTSGRTPAVGGVTSILTPCAWTSRDTAFSWSHITYNTYSTYKTYFIQHETQRIARSNGTLAVDCSRDPPPKPSQARSTLPCRQPHQLNANA